MGLKILSLFDGMSCGMIAFRKIVESRGGQIDEYHAYEIDKYAIQTSKHNFPEIIHHGDVFEGDFTRFEGFDYLIGGSPCTYWSIAQSPDKRETTASGLGWELFSQYVRALNEAKPKYFLYENNKSMSKDIYKSISATFGFEPICINSALVSAQNRQRLYWVGKRNSDDTYSKVDIEQPKDRGILLRDILNRGQDLTSNNKSYTLTASYDGAVAWNTIERKQRNMVVEPVCVTEDGKSQTLKAQYYKNSIANFCCYTSTYGASGVAEPVCMRYRRSEEAKRVRKDYESGKIHHGYHELSELHPREDGKTNTLSTVLKDNPICEPVGELTLNAKQVGALPRPNGELSKSQGFRIYSPDGKSVALKGNAGGTGGKTGLYAIPIEFENNEPTKAVSTTDNKTYTVYKVQDGKIEIKGKTYPIKLNDGYYIIRKLTVNECKKLQTVPNWFEFPVSDTQAYKCLGNGWTVDVIVHLLEATMK